MGAFWNEEPRIERLLDKMAQYFDNWAIAIQKSDDRTLEIAKQYGSLSRKVVDDEHRGLGEASFPLLIDQMVDTDWVFVVSGDEMPEDKLLDSIPDIVRAAEHRLVDGVYIPMRSWIEEFEFTGEQDRHLRLFRRRVGWPRTMHSRPMTDNVWHLPMQYGSILHIRTLDEMMLDYLRYYEMGKGNKQWEAHNKLMMHDACVAIAERKGWDFVQTKPWWDQVAKIAF